MIEALVVLVVMAIMTAAWLFMGYYAVAIQASYVREKYGDKAWTFDIKLIGYIEVLLGPIFLLVAFCTTPEHKSKPFWGWTNI